MKECMKTEKNMGKESLLLQMGLGMMGILIKMIFTATVSTNGPTVEITKDNGKETKCMEKELQFG